MFGALAVTTAPAEPKPLVAAGASAVGVRSPLRAGDEVAGIDPSPSAQ